MAIESSLKPLNKNNIYLIRLNTTQADVCIALKLFTETVSGYYNTVKAYMTSMKKIFGRPNFLLQLIVSGSDF